MRCIALIVAAGSGQRAGGGLPKQYQRLGGKPLLRQTLDIFLSHPKVDAVQVVIAPEHRTLYDAAVKGLALLPPVEGGATRQASVLAGLEAVAGADYVLIHDAARPFLASEAIDRLLTQLEKTSTAILAVPAADTIKQRKDGRVTTLDRNTLWQAQTPQAFHLPVILDAHRKAAGKDLSDDAAVAETAGVSIHFVEGSRHNWKVTTAEDLAEAERKFAPPHPTLRTGFGLDVHRFIPSATGTIRIGGVDIAHDKGLEGHSDADVALHAITDALLGTIADGDIGQHFSPKDPRWKDMDSAHFLKHTVALITDQGGQLTHCDVTIIGEEPKIGPHREAIRHSIAACTGLPVASVSVKATTTEGLGFTGRKEGLAAMAVVTVEFSPRPL